MLGVFQNFREEIIIIHTKWGTLGARMYISVKRNLCDFTSAWHALWTKRIDRSILPAEKCANLHQSVRTTADKAGLVQKQGPKPQNFGPTQKILTGKCKKGKHRKVLVPRFFGEPQMGNCRITGNHGWKTAESVQQTAENFSEIFDASFYGQVMVAQHNAPGGYWTLISPSICMDSDI